MDNSTLEIVAYNSRRSIFVNNSKFIGEVINYLETQNFDSPEKGFSIPNNSNIIKESINICKIGNKLGLLFNWTSNADINYSIVILSSDSLNFKYIKEYFNNKRDFI